MAKKSNKNLIPIAIGAVVVLLIAGYALFEMQKAKREAADLSSAWMITGNACPAPAGAQPQLSHTSNFDEVAIAREVGGQAACEKIKENGSGAELKICQFIGPGALKVTTAKGTYDFAPPRGVDASIVVRDDVARCVLHINPALFN